jgi:hypothetical protein
MSADILLPVRLLRSWEAARHVTETAARVVISDGFPDPLILNDPPLWRVDHVEADEATRVRGRASS